MKTYLLLISLFTLCSCQTKLISPDTENYSVRKLENLPFYQVAHYDKYTLQVIVVTTSKPFFSCKELLTDSNTEFNLFPLVHLNLGETITADETTPLLTANAIGESENGPIIRKDDLEIVNVGKTVTAMIKKVPSSDNFRIDFSFSDKIYDGLVSSKYDDNTTIGMPVFSNIGIKTMLTTRCGEWKNIGNRTDEGKKTSHIIVRLIAPDRSKLKSIIPQQIIKH